MIGRVEQLPTEHLSIQGVHFVLSRMVMNLCISSHQSDSMFVHRKSYVRLSNLKQVESGIKPAS